MYQGVLIGLLFLFPEVAPVSFGVVLRTREAVLFRKSPKWSMMVPDSRLYVALLRGPPL